MVNSMKNAQRVITQGSCTVASTLSMGGYSFVYRDIICDERHMKCSRRSGRI